MKKITILMFSAFILVGCNSQPQINDLEYSNSIIPKSEINAGQSKSISISPVDQVAYEGAIKLNDITYCNKISDPMFKQECLLKLKTVEQPQPIEVDCTKLISEEKEACLLSEQIDAQIKQNIIQKEQETADGAIKRDQLVKDGDLDGCQILTVYGQKVDCEVNIVLPRAVDKNDISICLQASMLEAKEACKANFDKAVSLKTRN